ncbi:ankyrin repeat domain-containing protein [Candidatus Proelusimicrobium excrementi]|uniref:ankyrin repeat domain-containing protein n=1 Tax=Candidatus Proelusimicrobium excrementi TaxID=3416222 RepID=UPI003D0E4668
MEQLYSLPLLAQVLSLGGFFFGSGLLMTRVPLLPSLMLSFFVLYGFLNSNEGTLSFTFSHPWIIVALHGVLILPFIGIWVLFFSEMASASGPDSMGLGIAGVWLIVTTCTAVALFLLISIFPALFKLGKMLFALHCGGGLTALYILLFVLGAALGVFTLSNFASFPDNLSVVLGQFIWIALIGFLICFCSLAGIASGNASICFALAFFVVFLSGGLVKEIAVKAYNSYLHSPKHQRVFDAASSDNAESLRLLLGKGSNVDVRDWIEGTPLMTAAESGNLENVILLIEAGADVNSSNKFGNTALSLAAMKNHEAVVRKLVGAGAKINTSNDNGLSPLVDSVRNGFGDIALFLIQSGADVNIASRYPYRPALTEAAINGDEKLTEALIKAGADVNKEDYHGKTALQFALGWKDKVKAAELIYSAGGRLGKISNDDQVSPMMDYACSMGFTEVVSQLIQYGVKPNAHFAIMAAQEGKSEVLKLLISAGLDVNQKNDKGDDILLSAVFFGDLDSVKVLIENGADITFERKTETGSSGPALILASLSGHLPVVRYLAESGADLDIQNSFGETALMLAAAKGHYDVVDFLIQAGADINKQKNVGTTAVKFAAGSGNTEILEALIKAGADINIGDEDNDTPLSDAVFIGHLKAAEVLIKAGANVNSKNKEGKTPLDFAKEKGYKEIESLLKSAGAK